MNKDTSLMMKISKKTAGRIHYNFYQYPSSECLDNKTLYFAKTFVA
jgi:hypothetical protein